MGSGDRRLGRVYPRGGRQPHQFGRLLPLVGEGIHVGGQQWRRSARGDGCQCR